ncbi:uncharacterized protein V6R79_012063 [Siganus canaliculatus]
MERALVHVTLLGLLLASVSALPNKDDWDIYSFHINSTVASRYATTVITSRVANRMDESKEIEFHVRIPKNAFISKFKMIIDGQEYNGTVKAKEEAKQQYTEAVSRGQSAGLVSSVGRTLEEFKTSVTVAAHKKITFELTYEELLKRRLGKYELQIHARPMQPVKDFKVDVHIKEDAGISFVDVKGGLSTNAMANAISTSQADKQAWVHFYPTEDQQKTCDSCGNEGMNGDLIVVYEVNRDTSLGDLKRSAGYFVHHFAPFNLPRIPKNVVFVIDRSGSMHGKKMAQTRKALIHILNDLAEDDFFGLITFDSSIEHWKRELVQATAENLNGAKQFAQRITDRGATDINRAVLEGASMLNAHPREGSASILILLTDGDPTSGVTNIESIQSNVRKAIAEKFPLYCLGFGFDVNFEFLEKMSLQNNGIARRIYEDSDADLQLKGFYEEVATPLLTDVTLIYPGGTNLTQTNFSQYYNGSEIVVAGLITDNDIESFIPQVVAISKSRRVEFSDRKVTTESSDQVQRIWAYLTVKQLLEKELLLSGPEKDNVKNEALRLSLKYSFVTPLTSMVVTKPEGESTDVLHKPKEGAPPGGHPKFVRQGFIAHHPGAVRQGVPASRILQGGGRIHQKKVFHHHFAAPPPPPPDAGSVGVMMPFAPGAFLDYDDFGAFDDIVSFSPPVTTAGIGSFGQRFLLKTENQSLPLCFDIENETGLKLLHHPNKGLSVNGELNKRKNGGFKRIVFHFKNDENLEVDTDFITLREGQRTTLLGGEDPMTIGSLTVTKRDNVIDITAEDARIIILIHKAAGETFLWPALRQRPSDSSLSGLLALKPAIYDEVQITPSLKLQINNQEVEASSSNAEDHSIPVRPSVNCRLVPAESALPGGLAAFTVSPV